jgi:hypothetical protein
MLTALLSGVSALAREPTPAASAACAPTMPALPIYIVNEGDAAAASLDAARLEATRIWAAGRLRLVWLEDVAIDGSAEARPVIVIVRRLLVRRAAAAGAASSARQPLGWAVFGEDGPGRLIEISLTGVTERVRAAWVDGRRVGDLPPLWQHGFIGRALGRVLAHEIGHLMRGRAHTREGLMKPMLKSHELVEVNAPRLPRSWLSDESAVSHGVASRCEPAPHAFLH